ncbi:hypothetical protein [Hymenobacter jeollabukensis]|uniref:Uncharacterized protein n=1 Tax=Hymenobacter jeollabukensis TaxID=2025313 RepID=A0A5R8WU08_9BACT|nr:hypothetical protein [Hymenobacter jeollabukensis]TLM95262.1 hypothetical protein FDY95_05600 [Hymenobacter jeollabukensis]
MRKLHISAWAWVPRFEDDAALITAVSAPNEPDRTVLYRAYPLADAGPYEKWKPLDFYIDMPFEAGYNSQLTLYMWRRQAQQPVYLDDLRITEIR